MAPPVLLAIDDDTALADVERELQDRYARHYRVVCLRSPADARAQLEDFAASGEEVALVVPGEWIAGEAGSQVLDEVRRLHPHAKRGLLIAWGDWGRKETGDAIFHGIADGRFDHYVLRPSLSPDEVFHQTISGMLLEWAEANRAAPYTIHIVGESWSGRAYELREVLQQCAVVHNFCRADSTEGQALVAAVGEEVELPFLVFPDGTVLENPTNSEIAQAAGSPVNPERMDFDVVIVGARRTRGVHRRWSASYRRLGVPALEALNGAGVRRHVGVPRASGGSDRQHRRLARHRGGGRRWRWTTRAPGPARARVTT